MARHYPVTRRNIANPRAGKKRLRDNASLHIIRPPPTTGGPLKNLDPRNLPADLHPVLSLVLHGNTQAGSTPASNARNQKS